MSKEQVTNETVEKIQQVIQSWIDGYMLLLKYFINMTGEDNSYLLAELHSAEAASAMWFNTTSLIERLEEANLFPGKPAFKVPKDITVYREMIKLDSAKNMYRLDLKKLLKKRILEDEARKMRQGGGKNDPTGISILPLEEMTLEFQTEPFSGKTGIVIRYAHQDGFYRFVTVSADDIPPSKKLRFSDIAKLAEKKEAALHQAWNASQD